MNLESYYYNCSTDYIDSIDPSLHSSILSSLSQLPKRQTRSQINSDLFWQLLADGWNFDSVPAGSGESPQTYISLTIDLDQQKKINSTGRFQRQGRASHSIRCAARSGASGESVTARADIRFGHRCLSTPHS